MDFDFQSLPRKDLQDLCKRNKIRANMTNIAMADALQALPMIEGLEAFTKGSQEFRSPRRVSTAGTPEPPSRSCRRTSARKQPNAPRNSPQPKQLISGRGAEEEDAEAAKEVPRVPVTPATGATRRRRAAVRVARPPLIEAEEEAKKEREGGAASPVPQTPVVVSTSQRASTRRVPKAAPGLEAAGAARSSRYRTRRAAAMEEKADEIEAKAPNSTAAAGRMRLAYGMIPPEIAGAGEDDEAARAPAECMIHLENAGAGGDNEDGSAPGDGMIPPEIAGTGENAARAPAECMIPLENAGAAGDDEDGSAPADGMIPPEIAGAGKADGSAPADGTIPPEIAGAGEDDEDGMAPADGAIPSKIAGAEGDDEDEEGAPASSNMAHATAAEEAEKWGSEGAETEEGQAEPTVDSLDPVDPTAEIEDLATYDHTNPTMEEPPSDLVMSVVETVYQTVEDDLSKELVDPTVEMEGTPKVVDISEDDDEVASGHQMDFEENQLTAAVTGLVEATAEQIEVLLLFDDGDATVGDHPVTDKTAAGEAPEIENTDASLPAALSQVASSFPGESPADEGQAAVPQTEENHGSSELVETNTLVKREEEDEATGVEERVKEEAVDAEGGWAQTEREEGGGGDMAEKDDTLVTAREEDGDPAEENAPVKEEEEDELAELEDNGEAAEGINNRLGEEEKGPNSWKEEDEVTEEEKEEEKSVGFETEEEHPVLFFPADEPATANEENAPPMAKKEEAEVAEAEEEEVTAECDKEDKKNNNLYHPVEEQEDDTAEDAAIEDGKGDVGDAMAPSTPGTAGKMGGNQQMAVACNGGATSSIAKRNFDKENADAKACPSPAAVGGKQQMALVVEYNSGGGASVGKQGAAVKEEKVREVAEEAPREEDAEVGVPHSPSTLNARGRKTRTLVLISGRGVEEEDAEAAKEVPRVPVTPATGATRRRRAAVRVARPPLTEAEEEAKKEREGGAASPVPQTPVVVSASRRASTRRVPKASPGLEAASAARSSRYRTRRAAAMEEETAEIEAKAPYSTAAAGRMRLAYGMIPPEIACTGEDDEVARAPAECMIPLENANAGAGGDDEDDGSAPGDGMIPPEIAGTGDNAARAPAECLIPLQNAGAAGDDEDGSAPADGMIPPEITGAGEDDGSAPADGTIPPEIAEAGEDDEDGRAPADGAIPSKIAGADGDDEDEEGAPASSNVTHATAAKEAEKWGSEGAETEEGQAEPTVDSLDPVDPTAEIEDLDPVYQTVEDYLSKELVDPTVEIEGTPKVVDFSEDDDEVASGGARAAEDAADQMDFEETLLPVAVTGLVEATAEQIEVLLLFDDGDAAVGDQPVTDETAAGEAPEIENPDASLPAALSQVTSSFPGESPADEGQAALPQTEENHGSSELVETNTLVKREEEDEATGVEERVKEEAVDAEGGWAQTEREEGGGGDMAEKDDTLLTGREEDGDPAEENAPVKEEEEDELAEPEDNGEAAEGINNRLGEEEKGPNSWKEEDEVTEEEKEEISVGFETEEEHPVLFFPADEPATANEKNAPPMAKKEEGEVADAEEEVTAERDEEGKFPAMFFSVVKSAAPEEDKKNNNLYHPVEEQEDDTAEAIEDETGDVGDATAPSTPGTSGKMGGNQQMAVACNGGATSSIAKRNLDKENADAKACPSPAARGGKQQMALVVEYNGVGAASVGKQGAAVKEEKMSPLPSTEETTRRRKRAALAALDDNCRGISGPEQQR